jgi:hypothetical protein
MHPLNACVFSCAGVSLKIFKRCGRGIEECFK